MLRKASKKRLTLAWEKGLTPVDYSSLVDSLPENNRRTVYLSMEQVKAIADHASENVRAAIWIAMLTGCRTTCATPAPRSCSG